MNIGISSLLIKAVRAGSVDSVKELLKAGPDVNATDEDGNTALIITDSRSDEGFLMEMEMIWTMI